MNRYVLLLVFSSFATSFPLKNITIAVPEGTSTHGDPDLLCTPTKWTNLIVFFLGNYVAHAATALSLPGERWQVAAMTAAGALFFPTSGVLRAINFIISLANLGKNDLYKAARAGALCMVVRSHDWKPEAGDEIQYAVCKVPSDTMPYKPWWHEFEPHTEIESEKQDIPNFVDANNVDSIGPKKQVHVRVFLDPWIERMSTALRQHIHGAQKLPPGYSFAQVPANADFELGDDPAIEPIISSNYNLFKILVSGAQLIFTTITLYRSRGDQINRYGFAAFGLTVAPYAVMSFVNLLGSIMVPSYPTMYLVSSSISDEASRRHGCYLDGFVGRLAEFNAENDELFRSANTHFFWIRDSMRFEKDTEEEDNEDDTSNDDDIQKGLQLRFKTSIDPQPSPTDSASQPDQVASIELQPSRVEFCLPVERNTDDGHPGKYEAILFVPDAPGIICIEDRREKPLYDIIIYRLIFDIHRRTVLFTTDGARLKHADPRVVWAAIFIGLIPLAIIGALSGFKRGSSTTAQAAWTMTWLAFGMVTGTWGMSFWGWIKADSLGNPEDDTDMRELTFITIFYMLLFVAPTIGGFVVVGQMLMAYGSCSRIS